MTPRGRVEAECRRRGRASVVAECVAIMRGDEPDGRLLIVLGGPPAPRLLAGDSRADVELWTRVWATRGLLWALDQDTAPLAGAVLANALRDPAWRVREKAAQVVARHVLDDALDDVVALSNDDPVPRVRAAAQRAVQRLTVG